MAKTILALALIIGLAIGMLMPALTGSHWPLLVLTAVVTGAAAGILLGATLEARRWRFSATDGSGWCRSAGRTYRVERLP